MPTISINGRFLTQPITGVQRYALEICQALDELIEQGLISAEYGLQILAPRRNILHHPNYKHIPVRHVGMLAGHAWEQLELPWYSRHGLLFCPGNTAPLAALLFRRKMVITLHSISFRICPDTYHPTFRWFYNLLVPLLLRYGDAVVTVSDSERQRILQHFPRTRAEERLHTIPIAGLRQSKRRLDIPVRPNDRRLDIPVRPNDQEDGQECPSYLIDPFVLYVGSLSKSKNLQGVIDAVALVNQRQPVALVVAGAGGDVLKGGEIRIPENLQGRVHFLGQINQTSMLVRLYESARCFVFPTFYESFGLPPLEAMACGCPVVVSDLDVLHEVCGDAALYCNPFQPEDIAAQIQRLLDDEELAAELRRRGRRRAELFSWEKCAQHTFALWQRILAA